MTVFNILYFVLIFKVIVLICGVHCRDATMANIAYDVQYVPLTVIMVFLFYLWILDTTEYDPLLSTSTTILSELRLDKCCFCFFIYSDSFCSDFFFAFNHQKTLIRFSWW